MKMRAALKIVGGVFPMLLAMTQPALAAAPEYGGLASCESKLDVPFKMMRTVTADIDNDGDLDILAIGADNTGWIENSNGAWIDHPINNPSNEDIQAIATGDIDGDGDLDLVSIGVLGDLAWFENLGGGKSFDKHKLTLPNAFDMKLVATGDMDGDGKLDIVVGGANGAHWLKNTDGKGVTWGTPQLAFDGSRDIRYLFVADLDGDKRADLAVVSHTGSTGGLYFVHNANNGATFEPKLVDTKTGSTSNVLEYQAMVMADMNKDGLPDFVTFENATVQILENVGGKAVAKSLVHDNNSSLNLHALSVGDYDNDGDVDVLFAHQYSLSWMERDGTKWTEREFYKNENASEFQFATVVDVGQDGDIDVVASQVLGGGGLYWLENKTTARGPAATPDAGGPSSGNTDGGSTPAPAPAPDAKDDGGGCSQSSAPVGSCFGVVGLIVGALAFVRRRRQT